MNVFNYMLYKGLTELICFYQVWCWQLGAF